MYAVTSLTHVLDIMPQIANKVVATDGVNVLCEKLEAIESFEILEIVIRALQKIALENPYSILVANGMLYLLQLIDFFDIKKQKTILSLLVIVAKSMNIPQNIEIHIAPVIPLLTNLLKQEKPKEIIELALTLYTTITESMSKFCEITIKYAEKLEKLINLISPEDILSNLFDMMSMFTNYGEIKYWQNLMTSISWLCKLSIRNYDYMIQRGVLGAIKNILTAESRVSVTDIIELENIESGIKEVKESVVLLLNAVLPQTDLMNSNTKELDFPILESEKEKRLMEKREALLDFGEIVLPCILAIYDETASPYTKLLCLQIIDKLWYLCDIEIVLKTISPQSCALFVYDNLSHTELILVCFGLRLCEVVIEKLAKHQKDYITYLQREGVIKLIKSLKNKEYLNSKYVQKNDRFIYNYDNYYLKSFILFATTFEQLGDIQSRHDYKGISNQLKLYAYYKSEELFKHPELIKAEETNIVTEDIKHVEKQMEQLLKLGIKVQEDEWKESYKKLIEVIERGITNYELRCTGLISKLYHSLCTIPSKFMLEEEKVNEVILKEGKTNELEQMIKRHRAFTLAISESKEQALKKLIKRVNEMIMRIDKYVHIEYPSTIPSVIKNGNQRFNVLLMYSPRGIKIETGYVKKSKLPEEYMEDLGEEVKMEPELVKLHEMFMEIPSYPVLLYSSTTLKSIEKYLSHRTPQFSDLNSEIVLTKQIYSPVKYEELKENIINRVGEAESDICFRFYYNGYEIVNKAETLGEIISNYANKVVNLPRDAQGVLLFQLNKKIVKKKVVKGCINEKIDLSGLNAKEQQVLMICKTKPLLAFSQVNDKEILAAIRLLQILYKKLKDEWRIDKTVWEVVKNIKESDLLNGKIEKLALKQIQDTLQILTYTVTKWIKKLTMTCPFLLTEKTRILIFRSSFFDRERSMQYLSRNIKGVSTASKIERMKLRVDRKNILGCGIKAMNSYGSTKSLLEFDYLDENGSGLGPTLEFYSLSAEALRGLSFLWRPMEKNSLFPAPLDPESDVVNKDTIEVFKLAGWLCARAITDERLIDLPFDGLFWEVVLGANPTLIDIMKIDKKLCEFLLELDNATNTSNISDIGLTFVLPGYPHIELKKDGKNTLLTKDNIKEYLDLVRDYTLYKTINRQVKAFKEGFGIVLKLDALNCFKVEEIENLICGGKEDKWNITLLSKNIIPSQGFAKSSTQYAFLLEYLSSLDLTMQRLFLSYVTGSPRLPFGGFEKLNPKLTIVKKIIPQGESPDAFLPSVMTCQNFLKVPEYSSYEIFKSKFDYALYEGQNSFTLS